MLFSTFETDRLILRPLETTDAEAIFRLRSDDRVGQHLDRKPAATVADALEFIAKRQSQTGGGGLFYWAVQLKNGGPLVGTICLFGFSDDRLEAEIGYELLPDFWQKGFAEEAARAVLAAAFGPMGCRKITAWTTLENAASCRLLERLGFAVESKTEGAPPLLVFSATALRVKN